MGSNPTNSSKSGNYHRKTFPNAKLIIDNSLDPTFEPIEYDALVTSLSKYHTNCKTVLGSIKFKEASFLSIANKLRWKSGYFISKNSIRRLNVKMFLDKNYLISYMQGFKNKAIKIHEYLKKKCIRSVVSGGVVFALLPKGFNSKKFALSTPFKVMGTYGGKKTICSYSHNDNQYSYFDCNYIRVSVGFDYSWKKVAKIIYKIYKKMLKKYLQDCSSVL